MVLLFSFLCGFPTHSFALVLSPSFLPHLGTVNKSVYSDMFLSHFLSKILPCPAGLPLYIMSFPCDVCFPRLFLFSSLQPEISLCFISSHFFLKASSTSPFFYPLYNLCYTNLGKCHYIHFFFPSNFHIDFLKPVQLSSTLHR